MSKETAEDYCAGPSNLAELEKEFGLTPSKKKRGTATYDREDIDAAINRMKMAYRANDPKLSDRGGMA